MPQCFVIQPFDRGTFDKRYADTFAPAITDAGLTPYRVDQDPNVEIPIEAIERGIRESAICLADITTDNPNVWYELGFALASGKSVIMVCCDERKDDKFPFDIQHRTVVNYSSKSASDFERLKTEITDRATALLKKESIQEMAAANPLSEIGGLSQPEFTVLGVLAGESALPDHAESLGSLKNDVERAGFTAIAFGLGWRRLLGKGLVETTEVSNWDGETWEGARLTESGWRWVESHESMFSLKKAAPPKVDDDIPF
jgi:hypothetical protein